MNKIYTRINWENYPSEATALNETNLNKMDFALDEVDNRLIEQDATKLSKTDASNDVVNWTMDEETGVITVTRRSGEQILFDLNIEKIPVSFSLSDDGILTMVTDDGTTFTANIGAMIPILTFNDSDEIAVSVSGTGINKTYSFSVKDNSITENKLQPNFLADIKVQSANASASASSAASSSSDADYDAKLAQSYAVGGSGIRDDDTDNAKYYKEQAKNSSDRASNSASSALSSSQTATTKASEAATSAINASKSESNARIYATNASNSAASASESASTANDKATEASESATQASESAGNAASSANDSSTYATQSKSYAVGGTGTRTGEDTDNAKYYNEKAQKALSEMQKSQVTGVKGNNETKFRTGNVNLTPANLGALATNGNSKSNTVTFTSNDVSDGNATSWTSVTALTSGITHATFFQRVSQMFKNVRYLYKMLGTTDISKIGDGTITGALSTINSNLSKALFLKQFAVKNGLTLDPGQRISYSYDRNTFDVQGYVLLSFFTFSSGQNYVSIDVAFVDNNVYFTIINNHQSSSLTFDVRCLIVYGKKEIVNIAN